MSDVAGDGHEEDDQQSGGESPPKLVVSQRDLERFAEPARPSSRTHDGSSAQSRRPTDAKTVESSDLPAIFVGALGIGSLFLLPLKYALLTLGFAVAVVAWKFRAIGRVIGLGVAACILMGAGAVWAFDIGGNDSAPNQELAIGKMRLAVVNEINYLREQRRLEPLQFDPGLSIFAQQQANYAAAAHTGTATEPTAGKSPAKETNMWAEMAGVSCSVQRLFELSRLVRRNHRASHVELGFIYGGSDVGPGKALPVLSPRFNSIGVGLKHLPTGAVSVQIDVTGRFKPGAYWHQVVPNLIAQVVGIGVPECG